MKKFLTFLLAFSLCLTVLGTYGFESPAVCTDESCDEHNHAGHVLLAADTVDYLTATVTSQQYNETQDTFTVLIDIELLSGSKISGGTVTIKTKGSVLQKPALASSCYLFGEFISSTSSDKITTSSSETYTYFTVKIPEAGEDSRPSYGSIAIVYSVDSEYFDILTTLRTQILTVSGSAKKADGTTLVFDSASTSLETYVCNHDNIVTKIVKQPTCQETGIKETSCATCGYVAKREDILPIDHEWDYTTISGYLGQEPIYPTCTTSGRGICKCKMCNKWSDWMTIPPTGHTWGERYEVAGEFFHKCEECGLVEKTANQCPHDLDNYVLIHIIEESTCEKAGSGMYQCPDCGQTEIRDLPLAHKFGNWTVIKKATCTTAGSQSHTCTICGKTETETIPATGHSYGNWVITEQATCLSTGLRSRTCSACGNVETETIPATGHSFGAWTIVKTPTCISTGTQMRYCVYCGKAETQTLPTTGHTFGVWSVTTPSTCTKEGTETRICSVCGEEEQRSVAVNPNAHSYGEWKVTSAKTCITDGVKERTCELCGHVESAVDECTGHVFGEPTVSGKVTTKTCSICGYSEATKTVKDGVEKTLTSVGGSLFVTGSAASGNLDFEIGIMPLDRFEEYKNYMQGHITGGEMFAGYDYKLLSNGTKVSLAEGMELTLKLDASLEDYDVDFVILNNSGAYSTLGDYSRKGLNVTIDGADLTGAEMIFVVKGEENSPNIVLPIIIAVFTLVIAGAAVYFIMAKSKKKNSTF